MEIAGGHTAAPSATAPIVAKKLLNEFRGAVLSDRREERMEGFQETALVGGSKNSWRPSAGAIYTNWLQYVVSKRADVPVFPVMAAADPQASRKRSAQL
jgi:hypothetical protein